MRVSKSILSAFLFMAFAPGASAQYLNSPFSYNYIDLNYVLTDVDNTGPVMKGYGGRLSFDSPEGVRILLEWDEAEEQVDSGHEYRRQDMVAGVGFVTSQNNSTDMILDLKYLRGEQVYHSGPNKTESGYGAEMGVRTLLHQLIEFQISAEYRKFFISELGGHASLRFNVTKNFSIGGRYTYFESLQKLTAGLRFSM